MEDIFKQLGDMFRPVLDIPPETEPTDPEYWNLRMFEWEEQDSPDEMWAHKFNNLKREKV